MTQEERKRLNLLGIIFAISSTGCITIGFAVNAGFAENTPILLVAVWWFIAGLVLGLTLGKYHTI